MIKKSIQPLLLTSLLLLLALYVYYYTPIQDNLRHLSAALGMEQTAMAAPSDPSQQIHAPELVGGLGWLNVNKPLRIHEELKGKIVLLDFWTYCCINCLHVIPDLKKLEAKYEKELVVIGVHSAKFQAEKETKNIRSAILRYSIEHPVVNDADFRIWSAYGVQAWPTLILIDPDGYIVGSVSGEGHYNTLDRAIGQLVAKFGSKLNRTPLPMTLEKYKQNETVLSFPGKVLADEPGQRLFIADTNHHRIVVTNLNGIVQDIMGSGTQGSADGSYLESQFHAPQGMTLVGHQLYVTDTKNHLIRRVNLNNQTVETIAGTGKQGFDWFGGSARETPLNSPWDIIELDNQLFFCNAGQHQLWVYDPQANTVQPYAGARGENIVDGLAKVALLAQPSGITTDGTHLYFADSEVSALRMVERYGLPPKVKSLIGKGLFDFGDKDGAFIHARLQHPLGVAYQDGKIYIADTYNHKIKIADLKTQEIETFLGDGQAGFGTATAPRFYEPSGVSLAGNTLFVADTNNNSIRKINLQTRETTTLNLDFSTYNRKKSAEAFHIPARVERITLTQSLPPSGTITVQLQLPSEMHLNPLANPSAQYRITDQAGNQHISPVQTPSVDQDSLLVTLKSLAPDTPERIELLLTCYYCNTDNQGPCFIRSMLFETHMEPASTSAVISHKIADP
jgi:thiol-disulfide isomerase/thioredoxin/sugar lactone lactonase YvrE